jgi:hypothetical protein
LATEAFQSNVGPHQLTDGVRQHLPWAMEGLVKNQVGLDSPGVPGTAFWDGPPTEALTGQGRVLSGS